MNSPLLTDLYQLTMAAGYWRAGVHDERVCFHLFYRVGPFGGEGAIFAGLETVLSFLDSLRFAEEDIAYLRSLGLFEEAFLEMLQGARFELDIMAPKEGSYMLPHAPLLRVEGPLWQAQLVETALINMVGFETLIATKAARVCDAARDRDGKRQSVLEFGLRRAQGRDGGMSATRASYIGGCNATSNVLGGKKFGIPVRGTHAHSWVMRFGDEHLAFRRYAEAFPDASIFLVDTYDTLRGVEIACDIGEEMRAKGHEMLGVRLDSGDLAELSKGARTILDRRGFPNAKIVASDSLDEYAIAELKARGAEIDIWGVGTRLVTAKEQPALGAVYKLGAVRENDRWAPRIKLSSTPAKVSIPGRLQLVRTGRGDVLVDEDLERSTRAFPHQGEGLLEFDSGISMLEPAMQAGRRTHAPKPLSEIRQRALREWDARENHPALYLEERLHNVREQLIAAAQKDPEETP